MIREWAREHGHKISERAGSSAPSSMRTRRPAPHPAQLLEAAQAAAQAHGDHAAEAGAVTSIAATGTGESGTVAPCGHVPPHLSRVGEEPLLRVLFSLAVASMASTSNRRPPTSGSDLGGDPLGIRSGRPCPGRVPPFNPGQGPSRSWPGTDVGRCGRRRSSSERGLQFAEDRVEGPAGVEALGHGAVGCRWPGPAR